MKHPDAAAHTSFSRPFRFRSFFVCLVVLLLAVFTLFQTGERVAKADTNRVSVHRAPSSCDWLGTQWNETESGLPAIWTRRGTSNIFDAVGLQPPYGTHVSTITRQGNTVTVLRRESSDGNDCDYTGTLAPDGLTVSGTYQCTLYPPTSGWNATIKGCVTQMCTAAPSGMVAWWRAEGNANDSIGSNNGTLLGGAGFSTGMVGQSFSFDGSTGYVNVPDSASLDGITNAMSVETWINPQTPLAPPLNGAPAGLAVIFARRDPNSSESFLLGFRADGKAVITIRTPSSPGVSGSTFVSVNPVIQFNNLWKHIAGVVDTSTGLIKIYLDGEDIPLVVVQGPSTFFGNLVNVNNLFIGRRQGINDAFPEGVAGAAYYNGMIDEVSLYNRAVSATEIQSIYNAGSSGKCTSGFPCTGGPNGSAYDDTRLIARDGTNGSTGIGLNAPLGNRIPVILIHGIHGNRYPGLDLDSVQFPHFKYFSTLINALNLGGGTEYNSAFKTYSFHYVSDRYTTEDIGKALRDHIDETCELADKPIIIVAHSMGGIVARQYMLQRANRGAYAGEDAGLRRVQKLVTLGTPHHGTYGTDLKSRGERFEIPGFANWVFGKLDPYLWHDNGCDLCSSDPSHVNRRSLLWKNNSAILHFDLDANEQPTDMPDTSAYNNKIIAYYGDISAEDDPYWQQVKEATAGIYGAVAVIDQCINGIDDARLACSGYFLDSIRLGAFNVFLQGSHNIPAPLNDGFVPVESARFNGSAVSEENKIYCPNHNHLQMEIGGLGLGQCNDGKILFKSVRERVMSISVVSPSLMVGPDRTGFGSHIYNVARPVGSAPVSTIDVPLSNLGDAALQITSLSLAGANADQFVIVNPPSLRLTIGAESSVHITVGFNPTSPGEKTAELRAENSSSNSVVIVNISATGVPEECDLDFSPASQFMPTSGGSGEVMVGNISCPWTVSAVDDWIHPTALTDRVSFTVDANAAAEVRYGTMIVSVYGRSYLYSISQDATNAPCWLQLSSDQSVVQREAGGGSFYITAPGSCGWSFQSDSPWLVPSVETLNGSGSVGFTVADNPGADRSGIITIQGSATSAQYTVHQRGASISGTVTYGNAVAAPTPRFVSNVLMSGDGSLPVSVFTDGVGATAGQYLLTGFGAGSYTVTPSKTGGQNGAINSFDAARVAQHVTGISLLTGNQLLVADVSGNGNVNSFDAAKIAQVAAGLPFSPPNLTGTWKFVPVNRVYASIASNVAGEDFSALLMGEVSGNWMNVASRQSAVAVGSGPEAEDSGRLAVAVGSQTTAEKEIVVPVNVQGAADKNIISYEFDLRYDPSIMQPQELPVDVAGTVSRGLSVVTNAIEPGLLRVVVYGPMPIDSDGVLLNLRFTAIGKSGSVSPLTWERIMFNEGEPRVMVSEGRVEISY